MMPSVYLDIFIRSAVVFCFVLLLLRILGKRQIGQMTPIDLVLLLLVSNAVQNAMTGPDTSLVGGVVAAGTLFIVYFLLLLITQRSRMFQRFFLGSPAILINRGQIIQAHLVQEHINHDELLQALRSHGVAAVEDVRLAVLEIDGTVSVIKNQDVDTSHTAKPYHRFKYLHHK